MNGTDCIVTCTKCSEQTKTEKTKTNEITKGIHASHMSAYKIVTRSKHPVNIFNMSTKFVVI